MQADDQTVSTPEDHHEGPSQTRSYECNFCKKIFSNAQALGGHMNIHRKEKAKLIKDTPQHTTHHHHHRQQHLPNYPPSVAKNAAKRPWDFSSSASEDRSSRSPRNRTSPREAAGELKQLPLFDETVTPTTDINRPESITAQTVAANSREGLVFSKREVDLELRLGHLEPRESSHTMRDKKFF